MGLDKGNEWFRSGAGQFRAMANFRANSTILRILHIYIDRWTLRNSAVLYHKLLCNQMDRSKCRKHCMSVALVFFFVCTLVLALLALCDDNNVKAGVATLRVSAPTFNRLHNTKNHSSILPPLSITPYRESMRSGG